MPSWLGERLDVAYAIDVLHPLASEGGRGLLLEAPVISCALPLKEARECAFAAGS